MRHKCLGFVLILIWATQLIVAQDNVDINSLIKDISIDTQQDAFSNYIYKLEFVRQKKVFFGKDKVVRRFDVVLPSTMPKGRTYRHRLLLVYDSSRKLTQTEIVHNRKQILKDLEKLDSGTDIEESEKEKNKQNTGGYLTLRAGTDSSQRQFLKIDLLDLINNATFSNKKELILNGRDTISIDFRPIPDNKLSSDLFYLKNIEGTILVDKKDKRIIEVEGFPIGQLDIYRNQTDEQKKEFRAFHYLQTRVLEGFWFPKSVSLNFMEYSKKFDNLQVNIEFTFSDYKRFSVSVDPYDASLNKYVDEESDGKKFQKIINEKASELQ